MRSRTRNRHLLLTAFQIISACALMGDDFLIGYRITTQNSTIHAENLSVSKSMTPCIGVKKNTLILPRESNEVLETTLRHNEEEFFTFVTHQTLHLQSHQAIGGQVHSSTETLTLPTHCYAVEFNDDTATITLLQ
ncbi:MAG: hypothetical protein PHQ22_00645 [Sulfuricurvum sp.]|nr:hypothetical protein [Sulfuricurvum sp.]MDD5385685.1 hypothetical protein [Sulfuricurvum sp.]